MADGSLVFDTELDSSGLTSGLKSVGSVAKSAITSMTKAFALSATAVAAGATAAIKFGSEYETSIAKVQTMFGDVEVDIDNLNSKMLAMSSETGIAATELGEAMYSALSAGIPVTEDMTEATDFLESATKLAKAGFTDVETSVASTAKVLNAYNLDVSETDRVHGILMATQNNGITTVGELSQTLAQVTPVAAALGVNFATVGASLATMTAQGATTATATTQLKQLFAELGKEGTTAAKALDEAVENTEYAGMSFTDMMEAGVPLNEVLNLMNEHAEANNVSLLDMFSSIEAGQAALSLTGEGAVLFAENMEAMADTTGLVDSAYETMVDTLEAKTSKFKETGKNLAISVYNGFKDDLGRYVDMGTDILSKLQEGFDEDGVSGLISAIGTIITDAWNGTGILDLTDVMEIVENFEMPTVDKMEGIETARDDVQALSTDLADLQGQVNAASLKVQLGVELAGTDATTFSELIDSLINTGIDTVESYEYYITLSLKNALGEDANEYDEVAEDLVKPYFDSIEAKASEAGEAARKALVQAMTDGVITPEEAERIQTLAQNVTDIVTETIASTELKGDLLRLKTESENGLIDSKDVNNIVRKTYTRINEALKTAQDNKDLTIDFVYQAAAELEYDDATTAQYVQLVTQGLYNQMSQITFEGFGNLFNGLNDTLAIPSLDTLFEDYSGHLELGVLGMSDAILSANPALTKNARAMWNALQPMIGDMEEIKLMYEDAGMEVPLSIVEGLENTKLLEALSNTSIDNTLFQYLQENFGEGIKDFSNMTEDEITLMYSRLAEAVYTDVELPSAIQDQWDTVFNTSLSSVSDFQLALQTLLEKMGVEAGSLLSISIPDGIAQGLADGTMTVNEAAEAIVDAMSGVTDELENADAAISETAEGATDASETVEAEAQELAEQASEVQASQESIATAQETVAEMMAQITEDAAAALQTMTDLGDSIALEHAAVLAAIELIYEEHEAFLATVGANTAQAILDAMTGIINIETGQTLATVFLTAIRDAASSNTPMVTQAFSNIASQSHSTLLSWTNSFYSAGATWSNSLASGIRSGESIIASAVLAIVSSAISAAKSISSRYSSGSLPSYRTGLEYVPEDDYPALLHKGEAVLTAAEARVWRDTVLGSNTSTQRKNVSDLVASAREGGAQEIHVVLKIGEDIVAEVFEPIISERQEERASQMKG